MTVQTFEASIPILNTMVATTTRRVLFGLVNCNKKHSLSSMLLNPVYYWQEGTRQLNLLPYIILEVVFIWYLNDSTTVDH